MNKPVLVVVVPCYNEEEVLPKTAPMFKAKIDELVLRGAISEKSFVLFCNDGSKDGTWELISRFATEDRVFRGISLSRNRGHQNVLLAGLMEAKDLADVVISVDCDGQDDVDAMNEMVDKFGRGAEIVYGVRNSRKTDTWFKRTTAQVFYRLMSALGAEVVYNHADYRLVSARALRAFAAYGEVNLFLRGIFPLIGFKSDVVYYERHKRIEGESHYPLLKMLNFAWDGVTNMSVRPIRIICGLGVLISFLSILMIGWGLFSWFTGRTVPGWTSMAIVSSLIGGVQLISIGVIGEYVGKIYFETKRRPRYIVAEKTYGVA